MSTPGACVQVSPYKDTHQNGWGSWGSTLQISLFLYHLFKRLCIQLVTFLKYWELGLKYMKFQETRLLLFLKAEPKLSASYLIFFFFLLACEKKFFLTSWRDLCCIAIPKISIKQDTETRAYMHVCVCVYIHINILFWVEMVVYSGRHHQNYIEH